MHDSPRQLKTVSFSSSLLVDGPRLDILVSPPLCRRYTTSHICRMLAEMRYTLSFVPAF